MPRAQTRGRKVGKSESKEGEYEKLSWAGILPIEVMSDKTPDLSPLKARVMIVRPFLFCLYLQFSLDSPSFFWLIKAVSCERCAFVRRFVREGPHRRKG